MYSPEFIQSLRQRLQEPLPGLEAQLEMAPLGRRTNVKGIRIPEDARKSAVMILLYPGEKGEIYLPIQERNAYKGVHSQQMGLPGGGVEEVDENFEATALRETEEEIGVPAHGVEVLGRLSELYIPPSNYLVQPIVGALVKRPQFKLDRQEVAALIETPLKTFLEASNIGTSVVEHRSGTKLEVPRFLVENRIVWGATAMMMSEFRQVVLSIK